MLWPSDYLARIPLELENGIAIVGSDWHVWPGLQTTAARAFCKLSRELQPKIQILNGDVFDGPGISRHPRNGWEKVPTVKQELEAVMEQTDLIADSYPAAKKIWTIGNHDSRFENKLSSQTPQFEGVPGFSLKDRFPRWEFGMSFWINDKVVIKHRYKGGVHATHNNTINAGKSIVTGHLHSLKVTPFSDYNETRWGVDTGTMNDPYGPHARYGEDNPLNHRSGLIVLSFHQGELLWPEIVRVIDEGRFEFRGVVHEV